MKEQVEMVVKDFDNKMNGHKTPFTYKVTDEYALKEGATLYLFEGVDNHGVIIRSSAIEYPSGVIIWLEDWQNGYPIDPCEIEDYDWCTIDGEQEIMFDGLPRIIR